MSRIKTNLIGVYFRNTTTNSKSDKTYYITYKDIDNKTKELKIGKFSEGVREAYCNQKRNEIITKQRLGEEPPAIASKKRFSKDNSIEKLFNYYYEHKKLHNKHIEADKAAFENHLKDVFGDIPVEKLTREDVIGFQSKKIESCAAKTVNNLTGQLSTIIEYAIQNTRIKNIENIVKRVKSLKVDNNREQYLNLKEIEVLYKSVEDDQELYIFTKMLLNTGARLQGVYNITYKDVEFSNNIVTIKDFKFDDTYKTFISDSLASLLTHRFETNDNQLFKRSQVQLQKLLAKKLNDLFNTKIDKNDRKNRIVVHTLRHTFASHLAINGTPIFTIQRLMNHKDINSTMRYAKLSKESGRESIESLGF